MWSADRSKKNFCVEAEADFVLAKGEAEMKSWFAEVVLLQKRKRSRVGILSLLTMMLALFSSGIASADVSKAPEPTYYHQVMKDGPWTKIAPPTEQDAKNGVQWLVKDASDASRAQGSFVQFITNGVAEPFKYAEGLKAAMIANGGAEHGASAEFRKQFNEKIQGLDIANFGSLGRKLAFIELANRIMGMTKAQLNDPKYLENAFKDLLAELGLKTEEEVNRLGQPSPTTTPVGAPTTTPTVSPTTVPSPEATKAPSAEPTTAINLNTSETKSLLEQILKAVQQPPQNPTASGPGAGPGAGTGATVNPTGGAAAPTGGTPAVASRVGELNDAEIRKQAQEICDKFAALQNNLNNQLATAINPLKDALNDTFNQVAALSRFNGNNNNNQKNRLEDILPGLIAEATKDNRGNNQLAQAPQISPPPPRPAQRDRDTGDLPQPPPPQPEPSPPPQGMPFFPQYASSSPQRPINYSLPSGGKFELREAEGLAALNEQRTPVMQSFNMLNPQQMSLPDLVMAKLRVSGDVRKTAAALAQAKDKAARLDDQLEELKEGGRAALPDWVKRQEAQLKNDFEQAKKNFDQTKQFAQQASQANPDQAQQIQGYLQQQQQELNQKEQAFNQFQAEVEMKVEEANRGIKVLAKQRDRLMAAASKLEGQLGSLKDEEQQVGSLIQTNMQMQLAALQSQNQPQQAAGTPNVNRILGFQGGSTGPRAGIPSRLGAGSPTTMGTKPKTPAAGGDVARPSLTK